MNKASLSLLAVTILFVFSCKPQPATHGISGSGPAPIPVVITLGTKPGSDTYCFTVAPDLVTLSLKNKDQIQWIISDPTSLGLMDVKITKFKGRNTGKTDPFANGGTFEFSSVSAHSATSKPSGQAVADTQDTYDYEVVGTIIVDGKPVTVTLDPRVVISG